MVTEIEDTEYIDTKNAQQLSLILAFGYQYHKSPSSKKFLIFKPYYDMYGKLEGWKFLKGITRNEILTFLQSRGHKIELEK